jgi:hypothetical protein
MENVGIFYGHLEYFTAIRYNLLPFGIICGHLVNFSNLVCLDQEKSGNPDLNAVKLIHSCVLGEPNIDRASLDKKINMLKTLKLELVNFFS